MHTSEMGLWAEITWCKTYSYLQNMLVCSLKPKLVIINLVQTELVK